MAKVNILTGSKNPVFLRQLDVEKFADEFEFFENCTDDILWDYVVVYEECPMPKKIRCKKGGLYFFSGEPSDSRFYGKKFLSQFDHIIATHKNIKNKNFINANTALNWHFGIGTATGKINFDFAKLRAMQLPVKQKNISVITSKLNMMPGHLKRLKFLDALRGRYGNKIDYFGKGVKFIDDKAEAILPYKFHICLENTPEKNYWTEKFADPVLGFAVPIYFGDKSIFDYFDKNAFYFIDINEPASAFKIIDKILDNPDKLYAEKLPYLMHERSRLLNDYNFFAVFANYAKTFGVEDSEVLHTIYSVRSFFGGKVGCFVLRLKRGLYKIYSKITPSC